MTTLRFTAGEPAVEITRVEPGLWHALDDGRVTGRGEATTRPDGRIFLSVDAWHRSVFDQLAHAMLAALPEPLHTVVDETDHELLAGWSQAGLTVRRRDREYVVPTGPRVTGPAPLPQGVTLAPAEAGSLRELYRAVRTEAGWAELPAEEPPWLSGTPASCTVAVEDGEYTGLVRVLRTRVPRIGRVAVRAAHRRRGIARALLAHELATLHQAGIETAYAEVNDGNEAAAALFESLGAHRAATGTVELVRHGR